MSRSFETAFEYVKFLTELPITKGEIICTSFLPSSLFQKDILQHFYSKGVITTNNDEIVELLWNYGRKIRRAIGDGTVSLYIEKRALRRFCISGLVHDAYTDYEVGFSTRKIVLETLKSISTNGNVAIIEGISPYIFRLNPQMGVLIDVSNNTTDQIVQGLWIDDNKIIKSFSKEARRLLMSTPADGSGHGLQKKLKQGIADFQSGYPVEW